LVPSVLAAGCDLMWAVGRRLVLEPFQSCMCSNCLPPLTATPQLATSAAERAALVNSRLDPGLMDCVLDFLYR